MPCGDQGQDPGPNLHFIVSGPSQTANGTSPLALRYGVDLSSVPAGSIFKAVRATYAIGGLPPPGVTDPGGANNPGTGVVDWLPDGLAYLNGNVGNPNTPIDAVATFSGMGSLQCVVFAAHYAPPLLS